MNKKLALVLSTGAVLALTLTGCGDDDTDAETREWAEAVCSEVGPQVEKIQNANSTIAEASEADQSSAEVQKADSQAFQQLSEAYGALADAVDEAGDPPVEDGAELRDNAVKELNDISTAYTDLKKRVDGLDTQDQSAFADGLADIADDLKKLGTSGDEALDQLQTGELGQAMAEQPGCQRPESPEASGEA
ncbi:MULTISPECIES: small secreted protein [unclassified Streptomyces]|uniref:small secreted protein n=1 Tax=unclassified Streptomyces TaxID=2593676 RepID=UPI0022B61A84|nr:MULTISPECIES: small secreted protein [unclassified Streptomyces]MCZ7415146.1 small secreted protein [Streptomyces sp. WMMC897]MCZ7432089.1 small secreted protein [Streptomyces sp. WMMC1477]